MRTLRKTVPTGRGTRIASHASSRPPHRRGPSLGPIGRPTRAPRALSLVEVVVALVLLVFGLGGVLQLYTRQLREFGRLERRGRAEGIARQRLAELQGLGFQELKARYLKGVSQASLPAESGPPTPGAESLPFTVRLQETRVAQMPPAIRVTVEVQWGRPHAGRDGARSEAGDGAYLTREVTGYVVSR